MKVRSPVLGYNHNVRYADRLWHVQTEDSGVQNPHIFTHLFHDGTILATKRLDYDPASDIITVQKLMQTQHKAMLRELKAGAFDDKISKYLGVVIEKKEAPPPTNPDLTPSGVELAEPRPLPGPVEPFEEPPTDRTSVPSLDTDRDLKQPSQPNLTPLKPEPRRPLPPPPRPPVRPSSPGVPAQASAARPAPPPPSRTTVPQRPPSSVTVPRPSGGVGGRRPPSTPYGGAKPTAEGVVVARPAVIIGGDSNRRPGTPPPVPGKTSPQTSRPAGRWHPPSAPTAPAPPPPPVEKAAQDNNIFGGDLISEKSLDEVILAYLSEDLNDK